MYLWQFESASERVFGPPDEQRPILTRKVRVDENGIDPEDILERVRADFGIPDGREVNIFDQQLNMPMDVSDPTTGSQAPGPEDERVLKDLKDTATRSVEEERERPEDERPLMTPKTLASNLKVISICYMLFVGNIYMEAVNQS